MLTSLLQVALGGALGASGRYLVNMGAMRLMGAGFPWATLVVNVVGSLAMGVLVVVLAHKGGTRLAPLLMTGLLGGFTTFSAFSLDAVTLYERGQVSTAALYVGASVILSLAGLAGGMMLARGVFQ
ncbi:fluoride efflux transporter CrcB [Lentibacter algarum]|uniref:fluoride efflux transporter CrcB n=1 Tax=Lentibacter algarum TaxID=576131 RepID=UPI001C0662DD|nr:fluoride efflux transporter CrcB [Lentibacter algarum]MBU2980268.1 fluoride efflux transporter CrcB [Lentibacter algarum]